MEIYARNLIIALMFIFFSAPIYAEKLNTKCDFSIDLPSDISLKQDFEAQNPFCSYLVDDEKSNPFVNTFISLPWSEFDKLVILNQPLDKVGFFKLSKKSSFRYSGRSSYDDPRNLYFQKVLKTTHKTRILPGPTKQIIVSVEIKVKWLKPLNETTEEESVEVYNCIDAAISDKNRIVIMNWCLPKSDSNLIHLKKITESIQIQ